MISLNIGYLLILIAAIVTDCSSMAISRGNSMEKNDAKRTMPVLEEKNILTTKWAHIVKNPPSLLEVFVGSRVELSCAASGHPPPQIHWVTGREPEKQIQELITQIQEENNTVSTSWKGIGIVSSTYVIDCANVEDQGPKYCVSISKDAVAKALPTELLVNTSRSTKCHSDKPATIVLYSMTRFALEKDTVILLCRAVGKPKPHVTWLDNLHKPINPLTHSRHTILPNGDLQITNVGWNDMGEYVCKAQSGHTQQEASTFFYVTSAEKKKKNREI